MANALDMNITDKVVIFDQQYLSVPADEHPFLVQAGFGAVPYTSGTALGGVFLSDGESGRMPGDIVARVLDEDELTPEQAERLAALRA